MTGGSDGRLAAEVARRLREGGRSGVLVYVDEAEWEKLSAQAQASWCARDSVVVVRRVERLPERATQ